MVDIIGVPFDLCGRHRGSALGPAALRHAGLVPALADLALEVSDLGDLPVVQVNDEGGGLKHFTTALETYQAVAKAVTNSLNSGGTPLVVGGDHSLSIGSLSGALNFFEGDISVLWIDAHADLNTPESSPTGNLHGMPVSAALGLGYGADGHAGAQWNHLIDQLFPLYRLHRDRIGWIGLRDVDHGERMAISTLENSFPTTMQNVDRYGIERVVSAFIKWVGTKPSKKVWISFDVDSLDPVYAGGTGTTVMGGLSYREGHFLAELLYDMEVAGTIEIVGLDVVEVNPLLDSENSTATMAIEWLRSLFGERILEGHHNIEF